MPLARTQSVLKKVLPDRIFNYLYDKACNAYDVLQYVLDVAYYNTPTLNRAEHMRRRTLRAIHRYTMTSRIGLLATYDIVMRVEREGIKGSLVECGVARGGCSALMALITREHSGKRMWMFDSFEGLPDQSAQDGEQKSVRHKDRTGNDLATGYCLGTYEEVSKLMFYQLGLSFDDVILVKGWFQDTLPEYRERVGDIAVLRLDGDWYESTKCCLENLYDNIVAGGYVIIDDYQLAGCKQAVDEFLAAKAPVTEVILDKNGRCYFRRGEDF